MYKFPYYKGRPHVPLVLEFGNQHERALPLLDSGADFSLFHKQHALNLGLDWEGGTNRVFDSAYATDLPVKEFVLSLDIEGNRFPARICFAEIADLYHRPLLGRTDIFNKFRVTFSEHEQVVELAPIH